MPKELQSIEIDVSTEVVFDLIHDYEQRLSWDSMLSDARLLGGAESAGLDVRSVCVGTWKSFFIQMETIYISFVPGKVAAVRIVGKTTIFESFAATIRHESLGVNRSRTTYVYNFKTKPNWLRPVLEPIVNYFMKREVGNRLLALKCYLERPETTGQLESNVQGQSME